jgi:hypothetical protein
MKRDYILSVLLIVFLNLISFSKHSVSQTNCFHWVSQIDNGFYDDVMDIAVDDESNIYGLMQGFHEFTFADTTVFPTSATNCCFFKLDSNGAFQWAKLNYISYSYYDCIKSHTIICKQKVTMHKKWQIRVHRKQQLRVHNFPFFQKYNKFKERINFDINFDR